MSDAEVGIRIRPWIHALGDRLQARQIMRPTKLVSLPGIGRQVPMGKPYPRALILGL